MPRKTAKDYPTDWKAISSRTKERDKWTCQGCGLRFGKEKRWAKLEGGKWQTFGVHHKDRDTWNSDPANLVSLCSRCHCQVELPLIRKEIQARKRTAEKTITMEF